MVFQEYAMPKASGVASSIVRPTIEPNNFELQASLPHCGKGIIWRQTLRKFLQTYSKLLTRAQYYQR